MSYFLGRNFPGPLISVFYAILGTCGHILPKIVVFAVNKKVIFEMGHGDLSNANFGEVSKDLELSFPVVSTPPLKYVILFGQKFPWSVGQCFVCYFGYLWPYRAKNSRIRSH